MQQLLVPKTEDVYLLVVRSLVGAKGGTVGRSRMTYLYVQEPMNADEEVGCNAINIYSVRGTEINKCRRRCRSDGQCTSMRVGSAWDRQVPKAASKAKASVLIDWQSNRKGTRRQAEQRKKCRSVVGRCVQGPNNRFTSTPLLPLGLLVHQELVAGRLRSNADYCTVLLQPLYVVIIAYSSS